MYYPQPQPNRLYNLARGDLTYPNFPKYPQHQDLLSRQLDLQDSGYIPRPTTRPEISDHYSTNQVTNILKQIQGSFDNFLNRSFYNNSLFQQHFRLPNTTNINDNSVASNPNPTQMAYQDRPPNQNNFAKNYQGIPLNQQQQQ